MQYRKKPVVIEAMQYDGENMIELVGFMGNSFRFQRQPQQPIYIDTLEGAMAANPGDYIIRGVKGEFYPCKPDIFAATYDVVED